MLKRSWRNWNHYLNWRMKECLKYEIEMYKKVKKELNKIAKEGVITSIKTGKDGKAILVYKKWWTHGFWFLFYSVRKFCKCSFLLIIPEAINNFWRKILLSGCGILKTSLVAYLILAFLFIRFNSVFIFYLVRQLTIWIKSLLFCFEKSLSTKLSLVQTRIVSTFFDWNSFNASSLPNGPPKYIYADPLAIEICIVLKFQLWTVCK